MSKGARTRSQPESGGTNLKRSPKRCTNTKDLGLSQHNCGSQSGNVEPTVPYARNKTFDGDVVATGSDGIRTQ